MIMPSVSGRAVAILACTSLLGCATADVMRLDQTRRAPTRSTAVQVFLDEPTRPYTAIAMVQVSDQGWNMSLEALKTKMVEAAAAQGGDAVIIGQQSQRTTGTVFLPIGNSTFVGVADTSKILAGKVVVFTDK